MPKGFWTPQAYRAKRSGVDFVLAHRLLWSSHTPDRPIATKNTRPQRLTAPQTYYQDAIEITSTMLRLGAHGAAVDEAIEYILSKRNTEDRWLPGELTGATRRPLRCEGEGKQVDNLPRLTHAEAGGQARPVNTMSTIIIGSRVGSTSKNSTLTDPKYIRHVEKG